uniref:Uncharacterized protein n=1 Tax=Cucumis melo TaxID=3656 RepID=A0A9I9E5L5_CUCME
MEMILNLCRGLMPLLTRNVMSRTRIYGSSLMVFMSARREVGAWSVGLS